SNRKWRMRRYQGVALGAVFAVVCSLAIFAASVISVTRISRNDVLESLKTANKSSPDIAAALAAVFSTTAHGLSWTSDLTEPEAEQALRSAVFEHAEISGFGRTLSKINKLGKDIDGHPIVIVDSGRVRTIQLSGYGIEFKEFNYRAGCEDNSSELIATNGS